MSLGIRRKGKTAIVDLQRGDLVEADEVPRGITEPHPEPGERGVCFEEEGYHEEDTGPMVRFARGGVCNVYEGWVKRVKP